MTLQLTTQGFALILNQKSFLLDKLLVELTSQQVMTVFSWNALCCTEMTGKWWVKVRILCRLTLHTLTMKAFTFLHILLTSTLLLNQFKDGKSFITMCANITCRPKFQLKVWRLDQYGKLDTIAYGCCNLPNETGSFNLEVPTWRPMTGWREESYNFYLGGPPKLVNTDAIVKDLSQRSTLTSMSSGTVIVHCEVLMKGFRD